MSRRTLLPLSALIVFVFAAACQNASAEADNARSTDESPSSQATTAVEARNPAFDVSVVNLATDELDLGDTSILRDLLSQSGASVVSLSLSLSDLEYSVDENLRELNRLAKMLGKDVPVVAVLGQLLDPTQPGLAVGGSPGDAWLISHRNDTPDLRVVFSDRLSEIVEQLGAISFPTTFVVDENGNVLARWTGVMDADKYFESVQSNL